MPVAALYRLQHETSSREQLWSKSCDLDARLSKMSERNERLIDELRAKESAAATANGQHDCLCCARLLWRHSQYCSRNCHKTTAVLHAIEKLPVDLCSCTFVAVCHFACHFPHFCCFIHRLLVRFAE